MNFRAASISTIGYIVVTFPLAVVWHLLLFESQYQSIGYIGREEPIFLFGFFAISLQGILLSIGYPIFWRRSFSVRSGIRYALIVGFFFWTSHVLAFAAKGDITHLGSFFVLETIYLAFQFGIYGAIVGVVYKRLGDEGRP